MTQPDDLKIRQALQMVSAISTERNRITDSLIVIRSELSYLRRVAPELLPSQSVELFEKLVWCSHLLEVIDSAWNSASGRIHMVTIHIENELPKEW